MTERNEPLSGVLAGTRVLDFGRYIAGPYCAALLADPDRVPAVFHCAAGKDRTGVLAALVLSLLGVDDTVIATDYGLSRLGMEKMVEYIRVTYPDRFDTMADQPAAFLGAPEAAMALFLDDLRAAHG